MVTFWLAGGDADGAFTIHQSSGEITTTKALDRERVATYNLTVVAKGISRIASTTVSIAVLDVNDNKPQFDWPNERVLVNEDAPIRSVVFLAQVSRQSDMADFLSSTGDSITAGCTTPSSLPTHQSAC